MIVISNTSPLMNLAVAGQMTLLEKLYGKVIIPEAVRNELSHMAAQEAGMQNPSNFPWLETRQVKNQFSVNILTVELDLGEAEVIALAMEMKAERVLLDERRARNVARRAGLNVMGLLGVFMEAKHKKMIDEVKPILDGMMQKAGFRVGKELYTRVLKEAGEL